MNYKRKTREMPQRVKDKISAKMKGRTLSEETKQKISQGQKAAWAKIPHKQATDILWGITDDKNNIENKKMTKNGSEKTN